MGSAWEEGAFPSGKIVQCYGFWVPLIEHVGNADNSNDAVESKALSWGTTHVVRDAILDRLEG